MLIKCKKCKTKHSPFWCKAVVIMNEYDAWWEEQDYYYTNDSEQIKSMDCLAYDEEHSEEEVVQSFCEEKGYNYKKVSKWLL